jgi:hypothetical protein
MPFKSQAQRRFLFAQHPELAKKWANEYPNQNLNKLPQHAMGNYTHPVPPMEHSNVMNSPALSSKMPKVPNPNSMMPHGQQTTNVQSTIKINNTKKPKFPKMKAYFK